MTAAALELVTAAAEASRMRAPTTPLRAPRPLADVRASARTRAWAEQNEVDAFPRRLPTGVPSTSAWHNRHHAKSCGRPDPRRNCERRAGRNQMLRPRPADNPGSDFDAFEVAICRPLQQSFLPDSKLITQRGKTLNRTLKSAKPAENSFKGTCGPLEGLKVKFRAPRSTDQAAITHHSDGGRCLNASGRRALINLCCRCGRSHPARRKPSRR